MSVMLSYLPEGVNQASRAGAFVSPLLTMKPAYRSHGPAYAGSVAFPGSTHDTPSWSENLPGSLRHRLGLACPRASPCVGDGQGGGRLRTRRESFGRSPSLDLR